MVDLNLVRKSLNDNRLYKYIELPNGLRAVLISDPETSLGDREGLPDLRDTEFDPSSSESDTEASDEEEAEEKEDAEACTGNLLLCPMPGI